MMRRLVGLLAGVAATVLLALPAVGDAQQASTRQLEALSPRAANRAIQADLLSILKPTGRINSGMFVMLHGVGLTTQAHGTWFHGLCARDDLTLWYAPAEGAAEGQPKDRPVRPYSVQSSPTFRFLSPPGPEGFVQAKAPMVWSAECQAADEREDGWFPADDEFSAVQGALALQLAVQEIRAGRLKPEPCPTLSDRTQTCAQAILAVGEVSRIERIETCTAAEGAFCYIIELPGLTRVTIVGRGDPRPAAPSSIQSIVVEEYIVVT